MPFLVAGLLGRRAVPHEPHLPSAARGVIQPYEKKMSDLRPSIGYRDTFTVVSVCPRTETHSRLLSLYALVPPACSAGHHSGPTPPALRHHRLLRCRPHAERGGTHVNACPGRERSGRALYGMQARPWVGESHGLQHHQCRHSPTSGPERAAGQGQEARAGSG